MRAPASTAIAVKALPRGRALGLAARIRAIQERLEGRLVQILARYWREQAARAVRRFLGTGKAASAALPWLERKVVAEDLIPPDEDRRLVELLLPVILEAMLLADELAAQLTGGQPFVPEDVRLQRLMGEAGARIAGINAETRRAVQRILQEGIARGYSPWQIAHGVPQDGFRGIRDVVLETYRGRAETIARTELADAMQRAAHARYGESGVREVDIVDGPDCGWTHHDDPDKADGTRRSLAEAERYPISHPNCRRVSLPVLEGRRG